MLEKPVLGFKASIRPSLSARILSEQLDETVGTVPAELLQMVRSGPRDNRPWGAPVLGREDPRIAALHDYAEWWSQVAEPVELLERTLGLGDLLTLARQKRGLSPSELAERIGVPSNELTSLEHDQSSLPDKWNVAPLATLMQSLGVLWSPELRERVRGALSREAGPALAFRGGARNDESKVERYLAALDAQMRLSAREA